MKFKNKKGISPLIATVLVIGFTIVLAGVVMQFIMPLFTSAGEKAKADAALLSMCSGLSTELSVKDAKYDTALTFTIDNSGNGNVRNLLVKYFTQDSTPGSCKISNDANDVLKAGEIKRIVIPTGGTGYKVECTALIATSGNKIQKIEVTPEVYSEVTRLNSTCTGVVVSGIVY